MKNIIMNPIVQGIIIAVAAAFIIAIFKFLPKLIKPIRKRKVFSSYKYDEQMLSDGSYLLEEVNEQKYFFRGTVAHCIYANISSHNIAVNRLVFVIDKIIPRSYKRIDLICHYADSYLHFYVLNNGNIDLYNLNIQFTVKDGTESDLKELLGKEFNDNFIVSELKSGEIIKLASWRPMKEIFIKKYIKENWLTFIGNVYNETETIVEDCYLGTLLINKKEFAFSYCQGGSADIERSAVFLDNMNKQPQKFDVNLQYSMAGNSDKHIQVIIYPKETCLIKYHFEMYTDTFFKKCQSDLGQAHIEVPIYETDGKFFHTMREWLIDNKIEHYQLDDNKVLQKRVLAFGSESQRVKIEQ